MRLLLDTNILIRLFNRADPANSEIHASLQRYVLMGGRSCITIQNVMEFWAVCTRPAKVNGLGLSVETVRRYVEGMLDSFDLLSDPPDLLDRWLDLCTRYAVQGLPSHDARLVAVMEANGINRILTLNSGDFKRYPSITCLAPADL